MTDQAREAVGVGLSDSKWEKWVMLVFMRMWMCHISCNEIWIYNNKAIMNSKIALGPVGNTKIDNSKLVPMQHLSKWLYDCYTTKRTVLKVF